MRAVFIWPEAVPRELQLISRYIRLNDVSYGTTSVSEVRVTVQLYGF